MLNHCAQERDVWHETTGGQQLYYICDLIEVFIYLSICFFINLFIFIYFIFELMSTYRKFQFFFVCFFLGDGGS